LIVTIPQRQEALQKVIHCLYDQVDEMRIIFNNYEEIPLWVSEKEKIKPYRNTQDSHTSNAVWLMMGGVDGYVFTCDDDLLYPSDYVEIMLKKYKEHKGLSIVTMYGEWLKRPFETSYRMGRRSLIYYKSLPKDMKVDIAGVGCSLFHTDLLRPKIEDFPDASTRDLWFAVLAAKNKIPINRIASTENWLKTISVEGPEIRHWRKDENQCKLRQHIFADILIPLLKV